MPSPVSDRLLRLGLALPPAVTTYGAYVPAKRIGGLIFVAGQLPVRDGRLLAAGPVPSACTIDAAREAARQCVVNALAAVASLPGGLEQITGVVRVGAFILSDAGFDAQPKVADAASDLLVEIFGPQGRHVRAAVGTGALPRNASVEIEFTFEAAAG